MFIYFYLLILNSFTKNQEVAPINKLNLDKCEYDLICNPNNYCTLKSYNKKISNVCENSKQKITYELNPIIKCKEIFPPLEEDKICDNCSFGQYRKKGNKNYSTCEFCPEGTYMDKEKHEEDNCLKCNDYISNVKYIYPQVRNSFSFNTTIFDESGSIRFIYEKNNEKLNNTIFIEIDGKNRKFNNFIPTIKLLQGNHFIQIKSNNSYFEKIIIFGEKEGSGFNCLKNSKVVNEKINQCLDLGNQYFFSEKLRSCLKCPEFSYYSNSKCNFISIFQNNFFLIKISFQNFLNKLKNVTLNYKINDINYNIDIINQKIYEYSLLNNKILIGEELINIKLINGKIEKGVILEYKGKRNNNFITTYVYIKCSSNHFYPEISKQNVNKNSLGFIILSQDICPVCISSELKYVDSECENDNFKRFFKNENKLCQFLSFDNENKSLISNSSSNIISYNDNDIISLFEIKEQLPIKVNYNTDFYLNQSTINIPCIENEINISLILILVFFLIILFAIVYNCILSLINKYMNDNSQTSNIPTTYQDVKII